MGGTDSVPVHQADAGHAVARRFDSGDPVVLAQLRAAAAGSDGKGHGGLVPVAIAAAGLVGEPREIVEPRRRPQEPGLVVADQLDLDAERPLHGNVGPERPEVFGADADQVTGVGVAGWGAEEFLRPLKHGQRMPRHGGQRTDAVVAAHDAAGLAGAARADGCAFKYEHVGHPELDERAGRRKSGHAATDHHNLRRAESEHGGQVGQPGIQPVPARGTRAMAAASTVSAARSSGSR